MSTGFKTSLVRRVEVRRVRFAKTETKGIIDTQTRWTDKRPHPANMGRYEETLDDPEVSIAVNLLADMIAPSYYTEMAEEEKEDHPNKQTIDEYGERVNLDEDLQTITRVMLGKGFCPVERLSDYDLKILPSEGFYIWKNKKGELLKYTQEVNSATVATWQGKEMEDIILFINNEDPLHPYGKSLVDPIVDLIDGRKQMNKDILACIHRYGYPTGVLWTKKDRANIQKEFEEKEKDEWIFIGNMAKDELGWDLIAPEMRVTWISYIELIYYQIAEALHAPLLLYLKNSTEASANVMMEAVDRYIQGIQRYIKRRVERYLFEPQCHEPVPRLVWGQPQTGLEEIELGDIAQLVQSQAIAPNQAQDLLKQLGVSLPDPEWPPEPVLPSQKPFQKPVAPMPSVEQILEKLHDLNMGLNIIFTSFKEDRIRITEAMKRGHHAIDVYCERLFPNKGVLFKRKQEEEYEKWAKRLIGVKAEGKHVYKVHVD